MANFDIALERTLKFEGGYVNNPNDKGGETYCGISRKYWPEWEGWEYIDQDKTTGMIGMYGADTQLTRLVNQFYRHNFWLPIHGDEIESQEIAEYLFDFAVNSGIGDAVKALQKAWNDIFVNQLKVDGVIGEKTMTMIFKNPTDISDQELLCSHIKLHRLSHLIDTAIKNPKMLRYLKGLKERAMA